MSRYKGFRVVPLASAESPLSEHQIQAQFIKAINQIPDPVLQTGFAIPNAAKRSYALASMLKAEGFRTGMPDWCLPVPSGPYNCLWIEFKVPKKKPTPEQLAVHDQLRKVGGLVYVLTSADAAIEVVLSYLRQRAI